MSENQLFTYISNFEFENIKSYQKEQIDEFQKQLKQKNSKNQNVLHQACIAGIPSIIKFLLDQIITLDGHANDYINQKDSATTMTPLQYCIQACDDGMPSTVELLIQNGADPNIQTLEGESALHMASNIGQEDVVKILLKTSTIQVNIQNQLGETPLMQSIQEGQFHIFNILINREDININQADKYGYTAVHHSAITKGNSPVYLRALQQSKANMNCQDNDKNTPIVLAAMSDFKKFYRSIQTLLELNVDLSICNSEGKQLKHYVQVTEEEESSDYYQIIKEICNKINYDLTDLTIKPEQIQQQQQQQISEEVQQKKQDVQSEKKEDKKSTPKPEWVKKQQKAQQQIKDLQKQIEQAKENVNKANSLDNTELFMIAVIVPLLLIALQQTISLIF